MPVLFMLMGYMKLRLDNKNENFKRDFYSLGKGRFWTLIAIAPMAIIFIASTVAALVPGPELPRLTYSNDSRSTKYCWRVCVLQIRI